MRSSSAILITVGLLLSAVVGFLLLFWFAFPRWWPQVVIRHSPSLRHVLLADSYRCEVVLMDSGHPFSRADISDYARFERLYGDRLFDEMAACDDGSSFAVRWVIMEYLGHHLHQPAARKVIWNYSENGDDRARDLIYRHAVTSPRGIDASQVLRTNSRLESSPPR
jgi:hypothetical protein